MITRVGEVFSVGLGHWSSFENTGCNTWEGHLLPISHLTFSAFVKLASGLVMPTFLPRVQKLFVSGYYLKALDKLCNASDSGKTG